MRSLIRLRTLAWGCVLASLAATSAGLAYEIPENSPIADALKRADAAIQQIVDIPDDQRDFNNTIGALDDMQMQLQKDVWYTQLMASVSTDPAKRDLGWQANKDESDWATEFSKREDLYHAIQALAARNPQLDPVQQRYLDHLLRDYRRAGMALPPEKREKLKGLEKQLTELSIEFDRNINEDPTRVLLTAEELKGTPQHVLDALKQKMSGELYIVPLDWPIFAPIQDFCENETTRHKVYIAARRQAGQRNVDVLKKILKLRHERVELLGHDTVASYQLETEMTKNVETVWKFYEDLIPLVTRKAQVDFDELLAAKRRHTGDPAATLNPWDQSFYQNMLLRENYAVDTEKVREYFPLDSVLDGLFMVTGTLYGLAYENVTDDASKHPVPVWDPEIRVFQVRDKASGKTMGTIYMDLFPREAKDQGAWCWGAVPRKTWLDGTVEKPLIVMLCNFTSPGEDKPPLLSHEQLVTFFHEYGHGLHTLLSESRYYRFSGTRTTTDFVETPSQMFENWVWDRDVLKRFAKHYKTGEPIPDELVDRMIKARNFCSGLKNLAQIWLGMTDMRYHTDTDGDVDTTTVGNDTYTEVTLYTAAPNTFFEAGFGHLLGYQAGYYSYLWSLVYAHDIAERIRQQGMLAPEAGAEFREKILARGGTRDEMEMLTDYLGRPPQMDAFVKHLGLDEGE